MDGCFARQTHPVNHGSLRERALVIDQKATGREAKNLAKSGACDVPPREPIDAIGYYWRHGGRATGTL